MGSPRTLKRRRQRRAATSRPRPAYYLLSTREEIEGRLEALALAYDHYHGMPGYETLVRPAGIRPYRG